MVTDADAVCSRVAGFSARDVASPYRTVFSSPSLCKGRPRGHGRGRGEADPIDPDPDWLVATGPPSARGHRLRQAVTLAAAARAPSRAARGALRPPENRAPTTKKFRERTTSMSSRPLVVTTTAQAPRRRRRRRAARPAAGPPGGALAACAPLPCTRRTTRPLTSRAPRAPSCAPPG